MAREFLTDLTLQSQRELRLADADSSNYVGFKAPSSIGTNRVWTLPDADGTTGQVLSTNGTGTLSWATASGVGSGTTGLRNITTSTSDPSGGTDGDIWIKYTA